MTAVLPDLDTDLDLSALDELEFEAACDTRNHVRDLNCWRPATWRVIYQCAVCKMQRDRLQCHPCLLSVMNGWERICWGCWTEPQVHYIIGAPIHLKD